MTPLIDYSLRSTWQALYDLDAEPDAIVYRPHVRLSYHRATMMTLAAEMAAACVDRLGWQKTQKIVSVGSGFGWMVEVLRNGAPPAARVGQVLGFGWSSNMGLVRAMLTSGGYLDVVGVDTSNFIQTNKNGTEEADINAAIVAVGLTPLVGDGAAVKAALFDGGPRSRVTVLNEDAQSPQSRARIKQALGGGTVDIALTEHILESWADADCLTISAALRQLAPTVQHFVQVIDPNRVNPPFNTANWKRTLAEWKTLLPNDVFISSGDYRVA